MRIRYPRCFWSFLLILLFLGVHAQDVTLDKKLGKQSAQQVAQQMGLYELEPLSQYVSRVGRRLVSALGSQNPFDFKFFVVDDPMPNAFALPGGYIYVTRGILSLVASEDELACVMAHEIIHSYNRHSIRQMNKSVFPKLLEVPGQAVGALVNKDLGRIINSPIKTSNELLFAKYSRKFETEADELGVKLASEAGYDPSALAGILDRISDAVEFITNEKEKKSYFDDHPYTPDRIAKINKRVKKLTWTPSDKISADFPAPLDGMVYGLNPDQGVFRDSLFLHPDLNFALVFPEGWQTVNQPVAVGAFEPEGQAAVILGIDDADASPKEQAAAFSKAIKEAYSQVPVEVEELELDGKEASVVTLTDESQGEKISIAVLWVKMNEQLFKMIALATEEYQGVLKTTAQGLRTMTKEEASSISTYRVKVIEAMAGQDFSELAENNKSPVDGEYNAFLNAYGKDDQFKGNKKVKVIIEESYVKDLDSFVPSEEN